MLQTLKLRVFEMMAHKNEERERESMHRKQEKVKLMRGKHIRLSLVLSKLYIKYRRKRTVNDFVHSPNCRCLVLWWVGFAVGNLSCVKTCL